MKAASRRHALVGVHSPYENENVGMAHLMGGEYFYINT